MTLVAACCGQSPLSGEKKNRCSPLKQARDGVTQVDFAAASDGSKGFAVSLRGSLSHVRNDLNKVCIETPHVQFNNTCSQCLSHPLGGSCSACIRAAFDCSCVCDSGGKAEGASYYVFPPTLLRAGLRGRWIHMTGDSSVRGLTLSLFQQLFDVVNYSEDANLGDSVPIRQMNFTKLGAQLHSAFGGKLALGFIDAIISTDDGEVFNFSTHNYDAMPPGADFKSMWEFMGCQSDTSAQLNEAWSRLSQRAVRVTFRQCARAVHLENETFMDVVGLETGPDVIWAAPFEFYIILLLGTCFGL